MNKATSELLKIENIKEDDGKISFKINSKPYSAKIDYSLLPAQRLNAILRITIYTLMVGGKIVFAVSKDDFLGMK